MKYLQKKIDFDWLEIHFEYGNTFVFYYESTFLKT